MGENKMAERFIMRKRKKNIKMWAGGMLLVVLALLALLVPLLSPYSVSEQDASLRNLGACAAHWFGTDKFGRDLFTRVWYGARLSLVIGLGSALICGMIGVILGALAGYFCGITDSLVMRLADVVDAIPSLLYVILFTLLLGGNAGSMILGICVSGWVGTARIARTEIMRLGTREFAQAAVLAGASAGRVIWHHVLPNAAEPLKVSLIFLIPKAILMEAALSFMGVGIAAPAASLGTLILEGRRQMRLYPWQMLYPAIVLCLFVMAIHLIGDGVEEKGRWVGKSGSREWDLDGLEARVEGERR